MKKYVVNHMQFALGLHNPIGEVNLIPSQTVPGMTLSLKDLLARYVRGEDVTTFTPVFTDDAAIPDDLERLDYLDRLSLSRVIREELNEYRSRPRKKAKDIIVPSSAPTLPADTEM